MRKLDMPRMMATGPILSPPAPWDHKRPRSGDADWGRLFFGARGRGIGTRPRNCWPAPRVSGAGRRRLQATGQGALCKRSNH